jgi:signal transduction histidine kinase
LRHGFRTGPRCDFMSSLVYVRLIGFTAGTLLQLFWMVVILGYRRQRNFERVFFFVCLALFFFYAGSLLALNAQIYYAEPPALLDAFANTLLCAGLCFLPSLLVHLHFEYADTRGLLRSQFIKRLVLLAAYTPVLYFALHIYPLLANPMGFDFLTPGSVLGRGYGVWLVSALLIGFAWQLRFGTSAPDLRQQRFHKQLAALFLVISAAVLYLHFFQRVGSSAEVTSTVLALLAILPFAVMLEMVYRHNFLNIGRQRNLVYAVSATFLALLYLALVRRVSTWLAPNIPPEASAAILLFVLVIFIEPLQRTLGRRLQQTAQREMDRVQRLMAEVQQAARLGDMPQLVRVIEDRLKGQFEFADATLTLHDPERESPMQAGKELKESFPIRQGERSIATLGIEPHGAMISGETRAALEFLCEQLAGALDLCRLLDEKVRLERELAERERLALLGQMAASISHNLKNPLGSIKTILQVQMENPELPRSLRGETQLVLDEIGRLSSKLNQLLRFSRPAVRGASVEGSCDAAAVIEEVSSVLRHEAERRGVAFEVQLGTKGARTATPYDAVSDIVSNLVVNALEATPRGGRVSVVAAAKNGSCVLTVEDSGPGISPDAREKLLQPFFTTKTQGTGLGLAIVARRVAEFNGEMDWQSPVSEGRGTRFEVRLPMERRTEK